MKRILWTILTLSALPSLAQPLTADTTPKDIASKASKCSLSEAISNVARHNEATTRNIDNLKNDISEALKDGSPEKAKTVLIKLQGELTKVQKNSLQSQQVMIKVKKKLEKLRNQIKSAKSEHDKASEVLTDEDMNDAIWDY